MSQKSQDQKQKSNPKKGRKNAIIMDIALGSTSKQELLKGVASKLRKKEKFYIVTPNPEIILLAQNNHLLRSFLNQADFSLPDGVGLVWASRFLLGERLERIPGRVFFLELLNLANERRFKIFLLGSEKKVNQQAVDEVQKLYPNVIVKGLAGPNLDKKAKPCTLRDEKLYYDTLNQINKFKPDLLFVAFGAPKQEFFLADNLNSLNVGGAMVIGGTLDYFVGEMPLPPNWMSRWGLEWFWRLLQRPQRISRILKATVLFPLVVLKEKIKSKLVHTK